jgi:uncharacterized protein involved in response to NO
MYGLVTIAAIVRVLSPFAGVQVEPALWMAGAAWSGAFGLFALFYGAVLLQPRVSSAATQPI